MSETKTADWHTDASDARQRLFAAMRNTRYSGNLTPPRWEGTYYDNAQDHLDRVTEWLVALNSVLADVSSTTTEMASELNDLRQQRRCVREFLGLPAAIGDRA